MAIATTYNITNAGETFSGPAGEDLTGDARKFLVRNSDDELIVNTTSGGKVAGVLINEPHQDDSDPENHFTPLVVRQAESIGIISGAAITKGDFIMSDTAGKAITATETGVVHGVAQTTVTAADKLVMVELRVNQSPLLVADN